MTAALRNFIVITAGAAVLLVVSIGGVEYRLGGVHLRIQSLSRPLLLLLAVLAIDAARLFRNSPSGRVFAERFIHDVARRGMIALLVAAVLVYVRFHITVCGGLDSFGYVGASSLLAAGTLKEAQPLVAVLPFEEAARAAAPLGFVAAPDGLSRVPRFPLGLPAVMAIARVFGPLGPFFVPLLLGCLTLVLVYRLARDSDAPFSGLFAASLVAADPVFVSSTIEPMSDVPAAFWLIAATWLRIARPERPILAGVCAGMALLTRPVLVLAAAALIPLAPLRSRSTATLAATIAVFLVLQAALNASLYGSPWVSGYGDAQHLFDFSRIGVNAANFAGSITASHTPFVWILWLIGFAAAWRRRPTWRLAAIGASAALPYLLYLTFDDPARFVLPALIAALTVAGLGLSVALSSKLSPGLTGGILLVIALGWAARSHVFLRDHGSYDTAFLERKFSLTGEWFASHTPPNAVVLSALHSGTIRYYGSRETIRWDEIPPGQLMPTLASLEAHGYSTYLALDLPYEPDLFRERFRSELDRARMVEIARVRVVNIYTFDFDP